MGEVTLHAEGLSKVYRLGEEGAAYVNLRETITRAVRHLGRRRGHDDEFWALRDISFTLEEGQTLGLIGRNGAGKSTLLKILTRITEPSTGFARIRGRVGALLEVGTGFHGDLTGRENIYLNGAILGMSQRDVRLRFDEIVEFSGVEKFLDTPVKRYSSGMHLRLGFAVAAHLEPDVMVVDEVLAVGDAEFQRKCLGKMSSLGSEGRTVVFVSHDLGAIAQLCRRAIWLDSGVMRAEGPADRILEEYLEATVETVPQIEFEPDPEDEVRLLWAGVETASGGEFPQRDEPFTVRVRFDATRRIPGLDLALQVKTPAGVAVMEEVYGDREDPAALHDPPGEREVALTIPPILRPGDFVIGLRIANQFETFVQRDLFTFRLRPRIDDRQEVVERNRLVQPEVRWGVDGPGGRG